MTGTESKPGMVVRADAGPEIGAGHVMRTFALAQAWMNNGGRVTFITQANSSSLIQRLSQGGASVVELSGDRYGDNDLEVTLGYMATWQADWLVLDGYEFTPEYQQEIKNAGFRLLVIDDCADRPHYNADVLLNQNLHADSLSYSVENDTVKLLGTKYVMLRPEFTQWRDWSRTTPQVANRVLVSLGGGDSVNFTLKALRALKGLDHDGIEVRAVIGAVNPNRASLETEINGWDNADVSLSENVEDMSELMSWADVAVCGAGATSWELAYMGLPALLTVIADNQLPVVIGTEAAGTAVNLGRHSQVTEEDLTERLASLLEDFDTRSKMSSGGRKLIDGLGSQRVVDRMMEISRG